MSVDDIGQPGPSTTDLGVADEASVELTVPAEARHLRLARLTAASIAGDLGFDLDAIEDLRVAIDELCAAAIEGAQGHDRLQLRYDVVGTGIVIEGRVPSSDPSDPELHPVARELLSIVADEYSLAHVDGSRIFRLRKRGRDLAVDG